MRDLTRMEEQNADPERELADMQEKVRAGTAQADAGELIPAKAVFGELRRHHDSTNKLGKERDRIDR